MVFIGTQSGTMGFSQSDSNVVQKDREHAAQLDFSSLTENRDNSSDAMKQKYEKDIHQLSNDVETMQPNLRAEENYLDVTKRLKTTDDKLNKARSVSRKVELSYEEVKQKRYDKFIKMFDHVEQTIDRVYKDLTKSKKHPLGGNAYLSLNNMEEPWLGGIKVKS